MAESSFWGNLIDKGTEIYKAKIDSEKATDLALISSAQAETTAATAAAAPVTATASSLSAMLPMLLIVGGVGLGGVLLVKALK